MAYLALICCLAFIAWLLIRDGRRRPSVSPALWIPTALVVVLGSRSPSLWLGPRVHAGGLSNEASGSPVDQAFFLLIIAGAWMIATSRGVKWNKILAANAAIALFYGYFVLSSLWSDYPGASLVRSLKLFGTTVIVISAILSEKNPLEAMRAVYIRSACILFPLSVLFIKYRYPFTTLGRIYNRNGEVQFVGATLQKNTLGEMAMVFSLFVLWDYLETRDAVPKRWWGELRWDHLVLFAMGIYLLNISESKTSLVCLLIGMAMMFMRNLGTSPVTSRIVFFGALALPILLFFSEQFSSVYTPVLEALGRDATFTGRTDIWQHITLETVNPLVGNGFWNFWGGEGGRAIGLALQTDAINAHQGYLDVYIDGGFIGLALLAVLLLRSGRRLMKNLRVDRYHQLRFAFLIILIVGDLTESHFARPSLIWFTMLLMTLDLPFRKAEETSLHKAEEEPALPDGMDRSDEPAVLQHHRWGHPAV